MPSAADVELTPERIERLYRRTLLVVVISQMFGGAGLAAGVTVGALLAKDMLGADVYAGIPSALITLGAAASAFLVGRLSQRWGRRWGLAAGFLTGGVGALGIVAAAMYSNLLLLAVSFLFYGAGTSTNLQARYAGTDLAKPDQRARAIGIALVSTTFGAVAGPNLVDVMGSMARGIGVPILTGPFLLAAAAFLLAGLVLLVWLRPDPYLIAKTIPSAATTAGNNGMEPYTEVSSSRSRGLVVGATVMILTQIVMVAVMTMTPIHMQHHGHGLGAVGLVISIHIAAMFLPSLATGILVDKYGRKSMSYAAGALLLAAGLAAAFAPADSMLGLTIALALLGLGWNFGLISGTAMVVDATHPSSRAKTQGTLDVLVALAGASGGALSGTVVAHSSYAALSLGGGFLSLLLIPVVIWARGRDKAAGDVGNGSISPGMK